MSDADHAPIARQRGEAYWLLARLFSDPLDAETLGRTTALPTESAGDKSLADDLLAVLREAPDRAQLAERLAVEHARLFRGISEEYGPPPPYESLWREGQLMGDSTVRVATRYLEAGYQPEGRFAPCDHIVEELRFMAALCHAEHEARQAGRAQDARQARDQQQRFLDEHLTAWTGKYCQNLADQSREPLYQTLARMTTIVLEQDALQLRGDA